MKKTNFVLLVFVLLFFNACSVKNSEKIYDDIISITLSEDIVVLDVSKEVKSNISFNLGLSKQIMNHINVGINKRITPYVKNTDGLYLKKAFNKYNTSLKELTIFEFKKQIKADELLKNKYVPFGANHKIKLIYSKYDIKSGFLFSKSNIKLHVILQLLNKNNKVIYENIEVNTNEPKTDYTKKEILESKKVFNIYLNSAIKNVLKKHIKKLNKKFNNI